MHRSASTSRASEEFLINLSPGAKGSPGMMMKTAAADIDKIPIYNLLGSDVGATSKKDSHVKPGENVVHLIPVILVLCAFILWIFSHPVVDMTTKEGSVVQVEGLNIHGQSNQSHMPSNTKLVELEAAAKQDRDRILQKLSVNKS
ncbi:hypothetical protein MKW98_005378 [Papaver atlanticum]|uniref:Uncharacterized protein n=1 Tax=Papaver atlanticum TaxID=357466 RepID=A0AAD4RXS9_9MAGN|nr:hypothetical protein MKW98_005378 [Papaver atlanticum]